MTDKTQRDRIDFVEKLSGRSHDEYRGLFNKILFLAGEGKLPLAILGDISQWLLEFFTCDAVEIILREKKKILHVYAPKDRPLYSSTHKKKKITVTDLLNILKSVKSDPIAWVKEQSAALSGKSMNLRLVFHFPDTLPDAWAKNGAYTRHSFLFIPSDKSICGIAVLCFASARNHDALTANFLGRLASIIGLSHRHNISRFELRERVKELTCMYNIANLSLTSHRGIKHFLQQVVELLPSAYLNPAGTEARIVLDGQTYQTAGFVPSPHCQTSEIMLGGETRGKVEVVYREPTSILDDGPFLAEERRLLDSVTAEIATIIKHKEAELEQRKLQEQLRHADRLATIGKLAAGVAHELNEPLTGILGFAELLKEVPHMPQAAMSDISRIESAALHAREVVRTLLTFARQLPTKQKAVNANRVIREVAAFFEGRCIQQETKLYVELDETLPDIHADEAQIRQVVLNLMVNALQAVEKGGILRIVTEQCGKEILIAFQDNGSGIADDIKDKIFLPFFTTKTVDKGTGMGLSVVHGIVKAHKGRIELTTTVGEGSTFHVYLPITAEA